MLSEYTSNIYLSQNVINQALQAREETIQPIKGLFGSDPANILKIFEKS